MNVYIVTGAIDSHLNEQAYINPGLVMQAIACSRTSQLATQRTRLRSQRALLQAGRDLQPDHHRPPTVELVFAWALVELKSRAIDEFEVKQPSPEIRYGVHGDPPISVGGSACKRCTTLLLSAGSILIERSTMTYARTAPQEIRGALRSTFHLMLRMQLPQPSRPQR